jgi:hypothetical protein
MLTYCIDIVIVCDVEKDHHCWREDEAVLQKGQPVSVAKKIFKKSGWVLRRIEYEGVKHICPYCDKGLRKSIYE